MKRIFTLLVLGLLSVGYRATAQAPQAPARTPVNSPHSSTFSLYSSLDQEETLRQWFLLADHVLQTNPLHARTGKTVLRLDAQSRQPYLVSEPIPVKQGEVFQFEVYAYYSGKARNKTWAKQALALAATGTAAQILANRTQTTNSERAVSKKGFPVVALGAVIPAAALVMPKGLPKAYVQYLFYDRQGNYLTEQIQPISKQAKDNWQALGVSQLIGQDGYVRVKLANESKTHVWLDDVQVSAARVGTGVAVTTPNSEIMNPNAKVDNGQAAPAKMVPSPCSCGEDEEIDGGELPGVVVTAPPPTPPAPAPAPAPGGNPGGGDPHGPGAPPGGGGSPGNGGSGGGTTNPPPGLPAAPKNGQTYTYKDSYGNPVTLEYNAQLGLWILPAVHVQGTPPKANLTVGTRHEYTNPNTGAITSYVWTGTNWGIPIARATQTPAYNPEKEAKVYPNHCEAYKAMWAQSFKDGKAYKESAALITDKGVITLPMAENGIDHSKFVFDFDFSTKKATYDLNGVTYNVTGIIHTHPNSGVKNPSTGEFWKETPTDPTDFNQLSFGLKTYVIGTNNVYEAYKNPQTGANESKVVMSRGNLLDNCKPL